MRGIKLRIFFVLTAHCFFAGDEGYKSSSLQANLEFLKETRAVVDCVARTLEVLYHTDCDDCNFVHDVMQLGSLCVDSLLVVERDSEKKYDLLLYKNHWESRLLAVKILPRSYFKESQENLLDQAAYDYSRGALRRLVATINSMKLEKKRRGVGCDDSDCENYFKR